MVTAAWVSYRFADNEVLSVQVETDAAPHPDLIDELRRNARELYAEAMGVSVQALASGEGDGED